MRIPSVRAGLFAPAIALALILPAAVRGEDPPAAPAFTAEEIDQVVAPIALYPDELVSQILMASTYPLEIVEATRWLKSNANLKDDALTAALEKKTWDASVKSLVGFPDVLKKMDENLEWTQKLGDAFLAQQKDVMDAIQRLRQKAMDEGNLKTSEEQKVVVEEKIIVIESSDPDVIYVPSYNPTIVYGTWPYPAYPPYTPYPYGAAAFSFAAGVAIGAAWGYAWGGCNWGHGDVDIDINRNVERNRNINRDQYRQRYESRRGAGSMSGGKGSWQHDPSHRKGVKYGDNATAQRYNRGKSPTAASRSDYRGRTPSQRPSGSGAAAARPRPSQPTARPQQRSSQASRSSSAFGGYSSGSQARAHSSRGSSSRQSSASRGGGGARRGGGGGRGGGRR